MEVDKIFGSLCKPSRGPTSMMETLLDPTSNNLATIKK
jgi:hypothetical protein